MPNLEALGRKGTRSEEIRGFKFRRRTSGLSTSPLPLPLHLVLVQECRDGGQSLLNEFIISLLVYTFRRRRTALALASESAHL
jgi:hypothetical protein